MTAQRATWRCMSCHDHGRGTTTDVDRDAADHVRATGHQVAAYTLWGVA